MKKWMALLIALLLAALLVAPALAEDAAPAETQAEDVAAEAPEGVETAAEGAAEGVEEASEDAVEEAEKPAVSPVIEKLTELPWYTWVLLALLVVTGVLLALGTVRTKWNSHRIAMGAMCIAIAFVLSCIRLYRMPQGGSITPASMLPLILFMVACGPLQGFAVGCAFGLLKLIADPYIIHPVQMLLDYPLSYAALILGCLAVALPVQRRWQLPLAVLLGGLGRYIMAVLSGSIFFAEYAGEQNAWIYSMVYNISYIGVDMVVCMAIACIPGMTRLVDTIRGKKA